MNYWKDPIFSNWHLIGKFHRLCKTNGVRYLHVDVIPFEWCHDGRVTVTNNVLVLEPSNPNHVIRTEPSLYGMYYWPYNLHHVEPVKEFNCLINRMDPIRQSWLYQLIRRNIFDRGYVSFNMDISRTPWFNNMKLMDCFQQQFVQCLSNFESEHAWIKNQVPYKNFTDAGDITHVIMQSKFSIILETYYAEDHAITFSEKTFRCLQLPRPWMLFAHKNACQTLRQMGFDLVDDLIDHDSYDKLDSALSRQIKILDIACALENMRLDFDRLVRAAQHNQDILQNFWSTCEQDFFRSVDHASKLAKQNVGQW